MSILENSYCSLVEMILDHGEQRPTRNQDTIVIFGTELEFDLSGGEFPLLIGRKLFPDGVLGELEAFHRGPKCVKDFTRHGCNYWKQWADEDGSLRVDYGNLWLDFNGVNQLQDLIKGLVDNPFGRRHLITGWRPDHLATNSLPCCHMLYQWFVTNEGYLDMIWYQRSADTMIGIPSDIILAAAWNIHTASLAGLKPGRVKMIFGDTHIYVPHIENAKYYTDRYRRYCNETFGLLKTPTYKYNWMDPYYVGCFEPFNKHDLLIENYEPMDLIKFEVFA